MLLALQLLSAIFSVLLGLIVLLQRPEEAVRRVLFVFSLAMALWILVGMLANMRLETILLWNRLVFVFPVILAASSYFLVALLVKNSRTRNYELTAIAVLSAVTIFTAVTTNYVVVSVQERVDQGMLEGFDVVRGEGYLGYIIILCLVAGLGLWRLLQGAWQAKGSKRSQLLIIFYGFLGTLLSGLCIAFLLPNFVQNSEPAEYTFLSGLIAVGSFAYAIVKHRLFDVRLIIARTIAYVLLLFTLVTIYVTAVFSVIQLFFGESTQGLASGQTAVYLASAVFLVFTYNPLKKFFDKVTDRIFFRHDYDPQDVLKRLGDVAVDEIDLKRVSIKSLAILEEALKPKFASMYVLSAAREFTPYRFAVGETSLRMRREVEEELFMSIGKVREEIIVADLLEDDQLKLQRAMHDANVALIVRLETSRELVGHLFFGPKQNGSIYNSKDLQMLDTVGDELALAIQNSLRFQEIRDFNETLQERVNTATAELRRTNAKLQQLDAAKDEFISMASHQLRTPLTTVKGYLSMVLEGDAGDISHMQRKLLDEAYASSQRMVGLISDFLNVSRLKTGKFVLEPSAVALPGLITEEIDQLRATAGARELTLNYTPPENYPLLKLDENKMRQVIMNFIDNAIYYSRAGGEITIEVLYNGKEAIFKVHDQGIGVPAGERPHLFTKFYRASNARKARPDGTGIGLFMAKKVIVAHGGAVIFESKEGKGSTFGFQVPATVIERAAKKPTEGPRTKTK